MRLFSVMSKPEQKDRRAPSVRKLSQPGNVDLIDAGVIIMKTIIATIFLAGLFALVSPSTAYSQSVYGLSEVGYDSNTREIFGASVTWLDYQVAWVLRPRSVE